MKHLKEHLRLLGYDGMLVATVLLCLTPVTRGKEPSTNRGTGSTPQVKEKPPGKEVDGNVKKHLEVSQ